jgi:type II secretion system protein H
MTDPRRQSSDPPPASVRPRRGSWSGFTLMELMVVMALIAIAAAVLLPEMKGTYGDALLRSASRELVDALTLAHSQAVSFNRIHRFRLGEEGQYLVEKSMGRRGSEMVFAPLSDFRGASGRFDNRIRLDLRRAESTPDPGLARAEEVPGGTPPAIGFYPDGTADAVQIRLMDAGGAALVLRVNPVTSLVDFLEPRP